MLAPLTVFLVHAAVTAPPAATAPVVASNPPATILLVEEPLRARRVEQLTRFRSAGSVSRLSKTRGPYVRYRHSRGAARAGAIAIGAFLGFYAGGTLGGAASHDDMGGMLFGGVIGGAVGGLFAAQLVR